MEVHIKFFISGEGGSQSRHSIQYISQYNFMYGTLVLLVCTFCSNQVSHLAGQYSGYCVSVICNLLFLIVAIVLFIQKFCLNLNKLPFVLCTL